MGSILILHDKVYFVEMDIKVTKNWILNNVFDVTLLLIEVLGVGF